MSTSSYTSIDTTKTTDDDTSRLGVWTWIWFFVSVVLMVLFISMMIFYQRALTERIDPTNLPGGTASIDYAVIANSVGNAFRVEEQEDLNAAFDYCSTTCDCRAFSYNDNTGEMLILTSAADTTESDVFNTFWR